MTKEGNEAGLVGFILGLFGIIFGILVPITGFASGILGIIFSSVQLRKGRNVWAKWGLILSIIGILASIIVFILALLYLNVDVSTLT